MNSLGNFFTFVLHNYFLSQDYLKAVLEVLEKNTDCLLHPSRTKVYSKQTMHQFHAFFKKGLFETSKHGTG